MVVVAVVVTAVVLASAVAHAHDHLGRLDHPCLPQQAPAKDPFVDKSTVTLTLGPNVTLVL